MIKFDKILALRVKKFSSSEVQGFRVQKFRGSGSSVQRSVKQPNSLIAFSLQPMRNLLVDSPLEFVRKVKLKIASQLLDKGYNVSEVAYKTGFSDVKYFSRQFKAQFGISPSKQSSKLL